MISTIEEQKVTFEDILSMLRKKVRQHSIAKEKKIGYAVKYLSNKPP
ncbi:MAG: hypothetical protein JSW62_04440 [Thermoplasmatales archaeon]|jgi:hypothetical protein|nr:MAG: hypothetical protein JSW62_04440 [Thermoplasmatales archaeon]